MNACYQVLQDVVVRYLADNRTLLMFEANAS